MLTGKEKNPLSVAHGISWAGVPHLARKRKKAFFSFSWPWVQLTDHVNPLPHGFPGMTDYIPGNCEPINSSLFKLLLVAQDHSVHVEVKGQTVGIHSLILPHGSWDKTQVL